MESTSVKPNTRQANITHPYNGRTTVSSYYDVSVDSPSLVSTTPVKQTTNSINVSGYTSSNFDNRKISRTSTYSHETSETQPKTSGKTSNTYGTRTVRTFTNSAAVLKPDSAFTNSSSYTDTSRASVRMTSTGEFVSSSSRTLSTNVTSDVTSTFSNVSTVSTQKSTNHTTSDTPTMQLGTNEISIGNDCMPLLGIVSAVSAIVVVTVILTSVFCILKISRKWRNKLREEKLKTDIWTMSTFNNTIINENFADYTLAPTPMPPLKRDSAKSKRSSQKTPRSSDGSRDLVQSWYSDGSHTNSLRRNTFSEPYSIGKGKSRAHRQMSDYADDNRIVDGQYERGRTSTFSVGWNVKSRDRRILMHYEEPIDKSSDDFRVLQFDTMAHGNDDIFTEL